MLLGLSSAIEKHSNELKRYSHNEQAKTIFIDFYKNPMTKEQIYKLPVYLYTIAGDKQDGWMANYNQQNGMVNEYKTQATISGNLARCEEVDLRDLLQDWKILIN